MTGMPNERVGGRFERIHVQFTPTDEVTNSVNDMLSARLPRLALRSTISRVIPAGSHQPQLARLNNLLRRSQHIPVMLDGRPEITTRGKHARILLPVRPNQKMYDQIKGILGTINSLEDDPFPDAPDGVFAVVALSSLWRHIEELRDTLDEFQSRSHHPATRGDFRVGQPHLAIQHQPFYIVPKAPPDEH